MRKLWLLMAVVVSGPCFGWGDLGHSVVGEVAERLLEPETRKKLDVILAPGGLGLAEAATWPDHMRSDADFKNTEIASWHFVELDSETGKPSSSTNALWAIDLAEKIIAGKEKPYVVPRKNPKFGKEIVIDRMKAVYFLAHLIGDIHQPLHVGNGHDHGANDCLVKWFGDARRDEGFWNLHVVWDEGLLERTALGRVDLANDILRRGNFERYLVKKTAAEWADESAAIRPTLYPQLDPTEAISELKQPYCNNPDYKRLPGKYAGAGVVVHTIPNDALNETATKIYGDKRIPRLSYDYKSAHIETAKQQLLKGGVRLAFALERALNAK